MVDPATDSDGPLAFLTKQASDDARGVSALLPLLTDKAGGFVAQITDMTLCPSLDLVLGFLQLSPSVGMLFTSGLLLGNFAQLLRSLPFERPNATTLHDQSLSSVGRDGCQMKFLFLLCMKVLLANAPKRPN